MAGIAQTGAETTYEHQCRAFKWLASADYIADCDGIGGDFEKHIDNASSALIVPCKYHKPSACLVTEPFNLFLPSL